VLRSHYRAPIEVTRDSVADAGRALERLDRFGERFADAQTAEPDAGALARFRELMDDDMSTPAAMALLFELVTRANADDDQSAAAAAFQICAAVGLELRTSSAEIDDAADALRIERDEARAAKDWSRADALRDELVAIGYEVADTPAGTEIRRR
jgi:cysteinyl-tRNA synthetase